MSDVVQVAIIDDHPLILQGVQQTLDAKHQFAIVGVGSTASDALAIAQTKGLDVMLIDISMPGDGIKAARQIAEKHPGVKLIILTVSEREDHVKEALEIGVRGYVLKGVSGPELQRIVRAVHQGETYITPELASRVLFSRAQSDNPHNRRFAGMQLTDREKDVVNLLLEGSTNKQIAATLGLSEKTIKRYMSAIMTKTGANNRVEVVVIFNKLADPSQISNS
jgi:two-component system, NarL family, nitrate/nitrite response regulator NarL